MKSPAIKALQFISSRSDISIALLLILVIFMMILPLPTVVVDFFIAFNLATAVIILMLGVYIQTPLEFSSFPSVLLLTTLFRLALSITTTRLILLNGEAGDIIRTFGDFVVGGNLIVGLVIFLIITLVQFIVITKGSERIAEVSARFTLDAMPGKQMSVDSDLRASIITVEQARTKRTNIEKESQLFGSMDGAMKFVKGDAIAGIMITVINLVGGITIGMVQQDMSFEEAASLFSVLTIGDGLVAQVPALIIAISAGIIVSRVSGDKESDLGADIGGQIMGQPKALLVASGMLLFFAFIPGFPYAILIAMSALFGGLGYYLLAQQKKVSGSSLANDIPSLTRAGQPAIDIRADGTPTSFTHVPVIVRIAENLRLKLSVEHLNAEMDRVRTLIESEMGLPFPGVELIFDSEMQENAYLIEINSFPEGQGTIPTDKLMVPADRKRLGASSTPYNPSNISLPSFSIAEIEPEFEAEVRAQGLPILTPAYLLGRHLGHTLEKNAGAFIGIQETHFLLQQFETSLGELIKESQRVTPIPKIANILGLLAEEGIPITDMRTILETIAFHGEAIPDAPELSDRVRIALKRQIGFKLANKQMEINAILISASREEEIRSSIRQTPEGLSLSLDPEVAKQFVLGLTQLIENKPKRERAILVTSQATRRALVQYLQSHGVELPVLSDKELDDRFQLNILGNV